MDSPKLHHPLVLVHGLCGIIVALRRPAGDYFPGLEEFLGRFAPRVLVPRLSPTASVVTRASELKAFLAREVGRQPVHILGHSLGGLDARYAISKLDCPALSLTSIGTPHRGTSFADWGMNRFSRMLRPAFRTLGIPDEAFVDLTTENCQRFNEAVKDVPGVRYFSVAGQCEEPFLGPEWWLSSKIVRDSEGPNDGIVSVASAEWGEHFDRWPGDHLNLVNWPNRFEIRAGRPRDRLADYAGIVTRLSTIEH